MFLPEKTFGVISVSGSILPLTPFSLTADSIEPDNLQRNGANFLEFYHDMWNTPSKMSSDRKSLTYYNLEGKESGMGINDRGLRDINTENPAYQKYLLETLMNKLLADGCDGFRFDTAKHIAVKNGSYDDDYLMIKTL